MTALANLVFMSTISSSDLRGLHAVTATASRPWKLH